MSILFDLRKNFLKRKLDLVEKARMIKEKNMKKEEELELLKEKIRKAKQLKLTPKQKEILMRRRKKAMQVKERLRKAGKIFIKKLSTFADNVNREFEQTTNKRSRAARKRVARKKVRRAVKKVMRRK